MHSIHYRPQVERRRESRFVANARATLLWDGVTEPITIQNISAYGALVTGFYLSPIGARVTVIADYLEVCGTVIWRGVERCGLLLSRQVDPLAVIAEPSVRTVEAPRQREISLRRLSAGVYG
ncbi:PilZ domain-containing protein [Sphingobium sp. AS12]|uniref:PilZ domain-containing protein n=1 Tax=Sphingobium sp. AS12 TaxID=2849495 RepID=UPI001C317A75|nr:PilZ domain-containing protein [Sphingobium sp. AS12]MBV2147448.1 PilZ domain-containing protein [Sphingobium sp. AS12]